MVRLLRDIAVDPGQALDADNPLRQVVVNTHSPVVIDSIDLPDLLYLDEQQIKREGGLGRVALLRVPSQTWRSQFKGALPLAPGQIRPYVMRTDGEGQYLLARLEP